VRNHALTHAHTHMRTHAHTHARTHSCTHANTHALACTRTQARTHTHIGMHARKAQLGPTLCPGGHAVPKACLHIRHMCVAQTTGIALYLGPKSRQSSTDPIFRIIICQGALCMVPCMPSNPMPRGSSGRYSG